MVKFRLDLTSFPMELEQPQQPEKRHFTLDSVFDILYMVIMLGLIAYGVYVFLINKHLYSHEELITISYFFIPAFVFSATGIAMVKSDRSLLYAFIGLVISFLLTVFFYQAIWPII